MEESRSAEEADLEIIKSENTHENTGKVILEPRKGGFLKGMIWEAPDCWEADQELGD